MRPDPDIAIDRPGIVLPGLVARLSRPRNGVEPPDLLAGPDVERAHQALGVVVAGDGRALLHGGADDHHVAHHRRRGMDADLAGLEIDRLLGAAHDADFQINDAVGAEAIHQRAGLGVELDQAIAGGHVDDALVAGAIGPVGKPAAGELARRMSGARTFAQAVRPNEFAGLGVERNHRAPRAGGRVEHAPDHDRRAFEFVFRIGPEIVGLEPPRDLQLVEVGCIDLIERRIAAEAQVSAIAWPFAVLGRGLTLGLELWRRGCVDKDLRRNVRSAPEEPDRHCRCA